MTTTDPAGPAARIRDAAWNAVAIASLHWQETHWRGTPTGQAAAHLALARVLGCAAGHGLTTTDLQRASGLDAEFIAELLEVIAP